jgi:hypothetical protein
MEYDQSLSNALAITNPISNRQSLRSAFSIKA